MMSDPSLYSIVEATVRVLHQIQSEHACVPAGAILLKVLERHNYPGVYALSVRAEILNAAMHRYVEKHGRPGPEETSDELVCSGAMGSGVGNPPDHEWAGHVAIVIPNHMGDRHALLDLTIGQANVPSRGIVMAPMCLYVSDDFVEGKQPHSEIVNNCHVTYTAYPDDHNYDDGSNWLRMPNLDDFVQMVIDLQYSE